MGNGNTNVSARAADPVILRVQWPHADHELLRPKSEDPSLDDAKKVVRVTVTPKRGGKVELLDPTEPIKPVDSSNAARPLKEGAFMDFSIEPGVDEISVKVEFAPRFKVRRVEGKPPHVVADDTQFVQEIVWSVGLKLFRGGTSDTKVHRRHKGETTENEDPSRFYLGEPTDGSAPWVDSQDGSKTHQLVDWLSYSTSKGGGTITTLFLHTQVVDATELWRKFSEPLNIDIFLGHAAAERDQGHYPSGDPYDALRILAHTAFDSGHLFAVFIPTVARDSARNKVGAGVMFTPGYPVYRSVTHTSSGLHTQYPLNRYLLLKKRSLMGDVGGVRINIAQRFQDFVGAFGRNPKKVLAPEDQGKQWKKEGFWDTIPVGQASSVETSGKNLIWVIPLAAGKGSFPVFVPSAASGSKPKESLDEALRFLWANKRVAKARVGGAPSVRRIALAGFSMGGEALFRAIQRTPEASEVYAFDPNKAPGGKFLDQLLQGDKGGWLEDEDRILCLTAGLVNYTGDELGGQQKALEKKFPNRIFLHPTTNKFWGPLYWPDPTVALPGPGETPEPPMDRTENPELGQEWLRCIRPTKKPDQDPFSVVTHEDAVRDLFAPSEYPPRPGAVGSILGKPLPHALQIATLKPAADPDGDRERSQEWQKDIGHQFAVFGGASMKPRKGGDPVHSDYLTFFLRHWSKFDSD